MSGTSLSSALDSPVGDDWGLDEIMPRLVAEVAQSHDPHNADHLRPFCELRDRLAESEPLTVAARARLDIYEDGANSHFAAIARDLLKFALAPAEAPCLN